MLTQEACCYHYCSLVATGGHLYELDGRKDAPVIHGSSSRRTFLNDAVAVLKKFVAQSHNAYGFNMFILVKDD